MAAHLSKFTINVRYQHDRCIKALPTTPGVPLCAEIHKHVDPRSETSQIRVRKVRFFRCKNKVLFHFHVPLGVKGGQISLRAEFAARCCASRSSSDQFFLFSALGLILTTRIHVSPRERREKSVLAPLVLTREKRFWVKTSTCANNEHVKYPHGSRTGSLRHGTRFSVPQSRCSRFSLRLSVPPLRAKAAIWGKVSLAVLLRLAAPLAALHVRS